MLETIGKVQLLPAGRGAWLVRMGVRAMLIQALVVAAICTGLMVR